jgi:hypothetical protein
MVYLVDSQNKWLKQNRNQKEKTIQKLKVSRMLGASTAIYFYEYKDITEAVSGEHNITKQKYLILTQPDKQGPRLRTKGAEE